MIRNRRVASAAVALATFAAVGVCGVVAARVVRAAWETLVQQSAARTAPVNTDGGTSAFFTTTVASSIYALEVVVSPARTGSNLIHLFAYTPEHEPQPVVEWQGTAELPEKDIEPVAISILPITADHAVGEVSLPAPGGWQLHFTVRISDVDQATVSVTLPIEN
jgi:copper transport protein